MKKITLLFLAVGFSSFAQYTLIPDPNFEQALIDLGYDDVLDGRVLTNNIENVTELTLMQLGITDLTGIEDFSALTHLTITDNNLLYINIDQNLNLEHLSIASDSLAHLDVTKNSNLLLLVANCPLLPELDITQSILLEYLSITHTNFPEIDLSQNVNLWVIWANFASLTSIDVSNLPLLMDLMVMDNQLSTIDVSQNPLLRDIRCDSNLLTELDVSNNPDLLTILVNNNQIKSLNLTNLPKLWSIQCNNNPISELNLSQNEALRVLGCSGTPIAKLDLRNDNNSLLSIDAINNPSLTCIFVDDKNNIPSGWNVDPGATYVETEAECDALDIHTFEAVTFNLFPNPAKDFVSIQTSSKIKEVLVYDLFGKLVNTYPIQTDYSVSDFSSGIYIVKIQAENGNAIKKLLVK